MDSVDTSTFEMIVEVDSADIDDLGHVSNIVYVRWVQDAAVAHWRAAASAEHQAEILWIVTRHEIDYKQPAMDGEQIVLRTWIGVAEGLRFERHTEILRKEDRKVLCQARSVWCPVDPRTKRPRRVPAEIYRLFSKPSG